VLKIALFGILLANLFCQEAIAGSYIYKWRDAQGRLYFTDTPEKVPEQHRGQLSKGLGGKLTEKKAPPRMTRVPVERNHGAVLVPGWVNIHHRVSFFLDTGATYSQITPEDVLALKLDPDYLPPVQVQTADGRSLESQRVKLNSLRIGSFEIRDMEALVGDVRLLGLNVLEQFRMTMDLQRGVLILEPPSP
jgi:clan AA aspartic protease (TIGR02281 family)